MTEGRYAGDGSALREDGRAALFSWVVPTGISAARAPQIPTLPTRLPPTFSNVALANVQHLGKTTAPSFNP
jgi:hypothetical protein